MFKSKKYLIITIITVLIMIFNTLSYAVNETEVIIDSDTTAENEIANEEAPEDVENDNTEEEINKEELDMEEEESSEEELEENSEISESSNFYSIGKNDVFIDYPINGNAYIIANKVTIESEIYGDVFIITETLNITENAEINSVFVLGSNINIDGSVSAVYACADNLTINKNAYIERDVNATVKLFNIFGIIERNANVGFDKISFNENNANEDEESGEINGDLNYTSGQQATIGEHSVYGNINFNQKDKSSVLSYIFNLVTTAVAVFIIYLIISWIMPKYKEVSKDLLRNKTLPVLGFGAIGLVATPIVILIFMLLGITQNIAMILLAIYVFLLLISSSVFIIALSGLLVEKLKIDQKYKQLGIISLITIVIWAIKLIPVIGNIISILSTVFGIGLILIAVKNCKQK